MRSQDQCNAPFPDNGEIRCRKNKHESSENHFAEAEVVDKHKSRDQWTKKQWEWSKDKVIKSP